MCANLNSIVDKKITFEVYTDFEVPTRDWAQSLD